LCELLVRKKRTITRSHDHGLVCRQKIHGQTTGGGESSAGFEGIDARQVYIDPALLD
jgi:hypothetical protein